MPASLLSKVPLFSCLDEGELEALERLVQIRRFERGRFIVLAEDEGDEFFIIHRGRVKVCIVHEDGRELILSLLQEGDVFGELALLDGKPRSASVVALEPTELAILRRRAFLEMVNGNPRMATALLGELASRLRRTDLQIEGLALMNVASRVAKTILHLVLDRGVETAEGLLLDNRPTHQQLAKMAGTTRETVTRVINRLEKEGYLSCSGRRILVYKEAVD